MLLTVAGLVALVASNFYLSQSLEKNSAATVEMAKLLSLIEQAENAQLAFGELRYWMTDLAVSLLTLSEAKAKEAQARTEHYLDRLAAERPDSITAVRSEIEQYRGIATDAVDAYTEDRRVIGNTLLAQARLHSIKADQMLAALVAQLNAEAVAARDRVVSETTAVTWISRLVVAGAILAAIVLSFLVLRSIAGPLRQLTAAMDGLNAGNIDVEIPMAGPDELGAMAKTLVAFRQTMGKLRHALEEQRRREQESREAHEELKAAQANLIHSEKMASLGQLTAGIAHEIKNPLNFVNNFASLSVELLDELKEATAPTLTGLDEDTRSDVDDTLRMLTGNLEKIAEHGKRADNIVKSMLEHSRGVLGERRAVDLNVLVEEALNLAYHGARAQDQGFNVTLERDYEQGLKPIEVAPQEITRVFLNLFGNGFYAASKRARANDNAAYQPTLSIATREAEDAVEIKVRDNGTGIPTGIRDKLFQPFFTTKPTGEGTGLGLSISYDIVTQQHGGSIEVESEPEAYTEFTIRLPRH
jgi:signal transduction histidine kinase